MKITVFTSNQPRHLALIERLAATADEVYAVLECNTVFPGQVGDFFAQSDIMRKYFSKVQSAEEQFFGRVRFSGRHSVSMAIKSGDLNRLTSTHLAPALSSDVFVVFGSSFIQGWLADFLVQNRALNIHMGLSPYYRGSSCNFWALYDANPAMVGATVHLLTHGLDSGPILRHAVPTLGNEDPFLFTMKAVVAAFEALVDVITVPEWRNLTPNPQDKSLELRYSRNADFTDGVAADFLSRRIDVGKLRQLLATSAQPKLIDPFYF